MLSGCLVITGVAVASLSLVISLYMRPEETFRSRYRLIMKEMKDTQVPIVLRDKVETFYRMYWHKARAVSKTRLLPTYPPTVPASVNVDIYFEATQKARVLRDLTYQILSELARTMQTIHYIPGDAIIKRGSKKCKIIYITYGDIEMLTAEDDTTPILRFTRGTVLTPCGCAAAAAVGTSHLAVRAATFCTAHVLTAADLWRVITKHASSQDHAGPILASFTDHIEKVKRHYQMKIPDKAVHKSSILHFNRNLMSLKKMKNANGEPLLESPDIFLEIAGCYIMRNRSRATQTDTSDVICLRPIFPCILHPSSSLLFAWHALVATLILIICITHPYNLVYKKSVTLTFRFFDYVMTAVFILDLIVHLSTGANVEEGVPITFAETSSQQMRSHWFVLDVVATLPIFEFVGDGHFAGINKLLRLPKLFRVLKGLEESCVYHSNVLRFLTYTLLLLIACYLIASMQQAFMCYQSGYCLVTNMTHRPFWDRKPLDEETVQERIVFGLYWSISMINLIYHRETWRTGNWENIIYTMVILEICVVLRIFMESVYSATIMVTTALREDYDSRIATVKSFLIRNEVNPVLRKRFIEYLQLCWYTDKAFTMTHKNANIFYDLPPHVYQDIVSRNRSKYILIIPFMRLLSKEDLRVISSQAKLFYTSPNEILLNTGELSNEIYIIKQGYCEEYHNVQKKKPAFMKYEPPEPTPNMMRFRLPRKHEPDTEFLYPFNRLGFLSILRYVFPRYTIRPDGNYLLRYEWFRVSCALLSAQLFPHYTYLVLQWPWLYYVALFLDMSAYFDIGQRMLIGYFNEGGILVYHPSSTAAYYLKGAFLMDVVSCLPLENLESARKDTYDSKLRVTPTKQFLMLNRLIQLYRMPSAMMALKEHMSRQDLLLVFQAVPLYMTVLNVMTCFIVFYSVRIFYSVNDDGGYDWLIIPFDDVGGSWLHLFQDTLRFNVTETPWNLHVAIYFWVVYECSTTGYGVFQPSNIEIMQVLFIGIACSAMIITYYSVQIISIRANVNKSLASFQEHMEDIRVYLAREKISGDLQKETQRYYEYNWEKMGGIDYLGVLKLCDQITLRTDAILHIYGPTFAKCPILVNANISLLRTMGRAVHSVYFLHDMKILEHDDMVTDMYFVDHGGVEVRVVSGDNTQIVRLPRGSVFGNLETEEPRRSPYNVVATGRLHLLMIKTSVFATIAKDFPEVKDLLNKSKTGIGTDKTMYILGGDTMVRVRRTATMSNGPPRNKTNIIKYIYFQEYAVQIYLMVVSLACIYLDMLNAGYQINSTWILATLYALDVAFFLKIFTQHALPFLVSNKNIKKVMMPIRKMYFKLEFKYDCISVLPIELFSFAITENSLKWMVFSWLRLNRIFRIATVYKCIKRRKESITVNLTVTTIVAVVIWFTLFAHTTTCLWHFIGMMEDSVQANSSWIYKNSGQSHCDNHYICSLYFVITTFTRNGVGDIIPKKISEVIFVSILQILSTMIVMVYVGEFSSIIQYQSYRSSSFYSKYLELQHHIFEECEPAFLRQLVGCLKLYTYNEGMYVVKESEITDAMYVIHTGKVRETCEEMDASARVYPAGSYFGIMQGLLRNTPYTHSYETVIKSQVLTLKLDDWEYLLKQFPDSKDAIHKHMRQLGDDDTDHSNWPGGLPTTPVPLIETSDVTDAPRKYTRYSEGNRRLKSDFDENKFVTPPSLERVSHFDLQVEQSKSEAVLKKEEEAVVTVEEHKQTSFLIKIAHIARKLMGRISDPEILTAVSGEGKDELLLEEDEEATEALLAQFEAARKLAEKEINFKKLSSRRKNLLKVPMEDENLEKQMFSIDIDEPGSEKSDSQPFVMRPLRIRDSESDFTATNLPNKETKDILNLAMPSKSKLDRKSKFSIGQRDATATTDTMGKEKESAHISRAGSTTTNDEKAAKRTTAVTLDTNKIATSLTESPEIPTDTATTMKESSFTKTTFGITDSKTKRPFSLQTIDSPTAAVPAATSDVEVVIDVMEADSKMAEGRTGSQTSLKSNLKTVFERITTGIEEKVGKTLHTIEDKIYEPKTGSSKTKLNVLSNVDATIDLKPKLASDVEDNEDVSLSEILSSEEEIIETTLMTESLHISKAESKPIIDTKLETNDTFKTLPDADLEINDTQSDENVIDKAIDFLYPDLETENNVSQVSIPQTKPVDMEVVQSALESTKAAPATSIQTTSQVRESAPIQKNTNVHADQHVSPMSTTSVQVSKYSDDIQTPQENKNIQAAQHDRDTTATKDVTGTRTNLVIKEEDPNLNTRVTQQTRSPKEAGAHPTKEESNKSDGSIEKLVSFLSETTNPYINSRTMIVNPQPHSSFDEEAARKHSLPTKTQPTALLTAASENALASESSLVPLKLPATTVSELKLTQYLSEEEIVPAIDLDVATTSKTLDNTPSAGPSKAIEKSEKQPENIKKEQTSTEYVKAKGARSSVSRRFVHVRYEESDTDDEQIEILLEKKDDIATSPDQHLNYFTMDSDEPDPIKAQQNANNEDQNSQSQTSVSSASGVPKDKSPSSKKRSD
ncbi:unnamed protein product [Spodoptera exigua]|nr:unnamed protein product [Spodoptera exigua]